VTITRTGSKLTVSLPSGIGYAITFTHDCGTEADAEAWRVHLQARQDLMDKGDRDTRERRLDECVGLRRSLAAYKGVITKLRGQVAK